MLEVGLGGRLDATNVVQPELCVITPIDFDHERYLGRSLESIAGEKAGILKPGVLAVFAGQRPEAAAVLGERAREVGARVIRTAERQIRELKLTARGSRFSVDPNLSIYCPLAGAHQVENALTAAIALEELGAPRDAIEAGIARTEWAGRLERVWESPEIILDGAYNPAGARALAAYIDRFYAGRRVLLILGAMRDKAVAEIGGILFPRAERVIVTAPRQVRAIAPESLLDVADHAGATVAPAIEAALEQVWKLPSDWVVFIAGSLYLVAEARAVIIGAHR